MFNLHASVLTVVSSPISISRNVAFTPGHAKSIAHVIDRERKGGQDESDTVEVYTRSRHAYTHDSQDVHPYLSVDRPERKRSHARSSPPTVSRDARRKFFEKVFPQIVLGKGQRGWYQ